MTIKLSGLRFSYSGKKGKPVLNIPHWELDKQQSVFIHGPSGCGKSTLLNLISGIHLPTEGSVSVLDHELSKLNTRKRDRFRASHIGYVFQQFNLISYLNAIENIQLAAQFSSSSTKPSRSDIEALLVALQVARTDWLKPTEQLSIGQQQRVAIARAFINKPELLIADEPTSSLDQGNRDNFMEMLMSLSEERKASLVFVSHDMSLASHFSRVDSLSEINTLSEAS
jgi:putative ABC transport system ATP-binding protein